MKKLVYPGAGVDFNFTHLDKNFWTQAVLIDAIPLHTPGGWTMEMAHQMSRTVFHNLHQRGFKQSRNDPHAWIHRNKRVIYYYMEVDLNKPLAPDIKKAINNWDTIVVCGYDVPDYFIGLRNTETVPLRFVTDDETVFESTSVFRYLARDDTQKTRFYLIKTNGGFWNRFDVYETKFVSITEF